VFFDEKVYKYRLLNRDVGGGRARVKYGRKRKSKVREKTKESGCQRKWRIGGCLGAGHKKDHAGVLFSRG
jgi:hypothetical protein